MKVAVPGSIFICFLIILFNPYDICPYCSYTVYFELIEVNGYASARQRDNYLNLPTVASIAYHHMPELMYVIMDDVPDVDRHQKTNRTADEATIFVSDVGCARFQ